MMYDGKGKHIRKEVKVTAKRTSRQGLITKAVDENWNERKKQWKMTEITRGKRTGDGSYERKKRTGDGNSGIDEITWRNTAKLYNKMQFNSI